MRKTPHGLHCYSIFSWFTSILFLSLLSPVLVKSLDTITATQSLTNSQTIVSFNNVFELGFFTPGNSKSYVGIWYKNVADKTVVWVANRDDPLTNSSGALLKIDYRGNIVILDQFSNVIWSSSNQMKAVDTPVARLLDSDMKLGWDLKTGLHRYLRSWKSIEDPSPGNYSCKLDRPGFPELFLSKDQVVTQRSGPWNGLRFSGIPEMYPNNVLNFMVVTNQDEVYYSFSLKNKSVSSRVILNPSGVLERFMLINTSKIWNPFWHSPRDNCDLYRECGVYGICDMNVSPICKCMKGFEPKNPQAWNFRDGSDGCVRKLVLDCMEDGFLPLRNVKLPETSNAIVDRRMNLEECRTMCKKNCSCTAYANLNITGGGTGCVMWSGELLDMREYEVLEGGQVLYVRSAASALETGTIDSDNHSDKTNRIIKVIGITLGIATLLCGLCIYLLCKKRKKKVNPVHKERRQDLPSCKRDCQDESETDELELPLFDFGTIAMATNNFSESNKLGQGGFGIVYKGLLSDGEEIAVKRLSKNSGQGMEEFINEVKLIARLQHRNLVRLFGCCVQMDEKMMVYEYMQNRSLDSIIFSKEKSSLLNWQKRFNIICGIARGLLYLHQDSRFRIIHRDLKASNILLDEEMNPKISDFGIARIFDKDQTEANTKRVVGTYGYMSPEYAMDGLFSIKSDVFSFGVLVLEIVSGEKNKGFYYSDNERNLIGHAWRLWREEKWFELMDSIAASDSHSACEVLRCIHVALLCVQEHAEDRPTMSAVILMLSSETTPIPQPKNPGFYMGIKLPIEIGSSSCMPEEPWTVNQVTITMLDAR